MAIVGSGDIASVLPERDDLLFFASGVSNSQETRESEYQREVDLLLEQPRDAHIVYFGSLAVFYSHTRYTEHKLDMEAMVKANFPLHTIIRLGNITFGTNPHTLINYFKNELAQGHSVTIKDETRYICTKEELLHWVKLIPPWSVEMNITGKRMKVEEIVERYVRV